MIQLILIIYLSISISKIAKEKEVNSIPYILGTIGITILPTLLIMTFAGGGLSSGASILGSIIGIGLAFIPRAALRGQ